jgi:uncharacterized protein (DUF1684 family)
MVGGGRRERLSADLDLLDWRRRVGDLYRLRGDDALARFRAGRDELFRTHPQSPLGDAARAAFTGLRYFAPDAAFRVTAQLEPVSEGEPLSIDTGGEDGVIVLRRAGVLHFRIGDADCRLTLFAMAAYGHGLFLPFRDATAGEQTYGGGRYLADTVKDTDGLCLEVRAGSREVELDFNYAYNPSCAYDPRWACPLAPPENRLDIAIPAGEMLPRL